MRVCAIFDGDYPWDVRLDKMSRSLIQAGHSVHIVCRNLAKRSRRDRFRGAEIRRLPSIPTRSLNRPLSFPAFFNPLWLALIYNTARESRADLILVRDLPLAPSGILVGRLLKVPVVLDMAEDYPAMVRDIWRFEGFKPLNLLLRNPYLLDLVESFCVHRADGLITVVEESRDRLRNEYGAESVAVVSNTPLMAGIGDRAARSGEVDRGFGLVYVGGLQRGRNLEVILRGMALLNGPSRCSITLVGSGAGEAPLRKLARELGIERSVRFAGWVDHDHVGQFLEAADAGVIPHAATAHTNTTVPNKLFDYMAHGLPVLVSDTRPVQKIVDRECCGVVFRHDDPADFARALERLASSDRLAEMGSRGLQAARARYNWEHDSRVFLEFLEACCFRFRAHRNGE